MAEAIECFCTLGRPCPRPLNGADLFCKVCRRGCERFVYVDEPRNRIIIWDHQNSDTIGVMAIELEYGRIPPGGVVEEMPRSGDTGAL